MKSAPYQREVLPLVQISKLIEAFKSGSVPDIDLGMRGHTVAEREGTFILKDDVYIVDGLQRVTAGLQFIQAGGVPRLGATVHFGTTEEWERERFKILNVDRIPLSPNVLLRNLREKISVIETLYNLSMEPTFTMGRRICWDQRQNRNHLISALMFIKTVGVLHSYFGPGRSHKLHELARSMQTTMEKVGRNTLRANVVIFFDLVDECWGIKKVVFREGAVWLRGTFLWALADILALHENFWRGDRLFVDADLTAKIRLFPVTDPTVAQLSSSGGKARDMLRAMLVDHINAGKRTKRLISRSPMVKVSTPTSESQ
ncbi:hypothetical protein HYV30_03395 [Candidatus Kaiserbacteria bacterium]|nr:hypothetical protein [Candidatus Kaiserbacteria bacterium]